LLEKVSKILVIDDDKDMLKMLEAILEMDGYEVVQCHDPELAFQLAAEERPDLVLLDMMMPGKSGLDVMMEIRGDDATRNIPILFLSAVGEEAMVVKALKGADDYMIKPFKTLELEARIEKILARAVKAAPVETDARTAKPQRLPVQRGDETFLVPLAEICYFEASGKYSYAHTRSKRFLTGYSLGQLEERLGDGPFVRTHRSYIVNADFIRKVTKDKSKGTMIVLADDSETALKVSESHLSAMKEKLGL
jgi:DNA-binding LytR/AlgR family response regulator